MGSGPQSRYSAEDGRFRAELERHGKGRDAPAFPVLDIGKTPARGAAAELHGGGKLAIAAPAPDRVLGHAETVSNLFYGEVKIFRWDSH